MTRLRKASTSPYPPSPVVTVLACPRCSYPVVTFQRESGYRFPNARRVDMVPGGTVRVAHECREMVEISFLRWEENGARVPPTLERGVAQVSTGAAASHNNEEPHKNIDVSAAPAVV